MTRLGKTLVAILSILLCASIVAGSCSSDRLRRRLSEANQNLAALTDTIHAFELKNGELVQWNQALVVDNSTLKDELEEENISKKEIERELNSKIQRLTKIVSQFRADTIVVTDTVEILRDGFAVAPFEYSDSFLDLSGKTLFQLDDLTSETTIDLLSVRVPLTIGLTSDNKVFVNSTNPNARIELLESFSAESAECRQRRLGIGVYCGFGTTYGLVSKQIDFGPQAGVGVYWRLF